MGYREKIDVRELITEYVKQCENEYDPSRNNRNKISQEAYSESLTGMKLIDLEKFTEDNKQKNEDVVERYLYKWGSMGRFLGQEKKCPDWQNRLAKAIQKKHEKLKDFSSKDLIDVKLDDPIVKKDIQSCYEAFNTVIGKIAATKVLHLICPNFFPPWDNAIANGVRNEFEKSSDKESKITRFTKEDYYRFMLVIQDFLKQNERVLSKLARELDKTRLRVLDECLLWAVRRPYYLFSFRIAKITTS
jgi:hypothetical protein